jgi:putative ABC transport system permease protein
MRLYRLLLRLYPADFRARYEHEMCAIFVARQRDEHAVALWTGVLADVLTNATRMHADLVRQDLYWTFRTLRTSAASAFTAVVVAALGVSATTAAFTVTSHALLRPLPFGNSEQLVFLTEKTREGQWQPATPPGFDEWRTRSLSFSAMGAYIGISVPMNMSGRGEPRRPDVAVVTADVFTVLNVVPVAGRVFTPEDDHDDSARVAILSATLATAVFGSPTAAVGETIRLDSRAHKIVGVMTSTFVFPSGDTDVWIPRRRWGTNRSNHMLGVVARLRSGVSISQAQAEMDLLAADVARTHPEENAGVRIHVSDMRDRVPPQTRSLILAIAGASLCLLLVGSTNVASLVFAHAPGAGRERPRGRLLTESFVLVMVGGSGGVFLAFLALPVLSDLLPITLPISGPLQVDWRIVAFAVTLPLATTLVFGTAPAVRLSQATTTTTVDSQREARGRRAVRLRAAFVVAEVVGTMVLLVTTGLLLKAMWRVHAIEPGFRAEGVMTLRTVLPMSMPATSRRAFYSRVIDATKRLPGVTSAAYISFVPMTFGSGNFPVDAGGPKTEVDSHTRFITADYFRTMGIPLLQGRGISESDDEVTAPPVAVIGRSLADRLWPAQNAVGRAMNFAGVSWDVVGVVGDVAVRGPEQASVPQAYFPANRVPPGLEFYAPKDLVVHTRGEPTALVPAVRRIVHAINAEQAISDVRTLEEIVAGQTESRRVQLGVLAILAVAALLLEAVGIYGLLSFTVGASRAGTFAQLVRQGAVLTIVGVSLAMPLAYAFARGMTPLLFDVAPGDPAIYACASALALLVAFIASATPALNAARASLPLS